YHRAHVGSLGIVVVTGATALAHELEPVLKPGKIIQCLLNRVVVQAGAFGRGHGGHHIFHVVHTLYLRTSEREAFFCTAVAPDDFVVRRKNAFGPFSETKGDDPASDPRTHCPDQRIVTIENRSVSVSLKPE